MDEIQVAFRDVEDARPVVREVARHTPTIPFGDEDGILLKLENLQRLGVFKIRGTWNRVSRLSAEDRRRGLTTISSGNHGMSLAWAAQRLGVPCVVRVPEEAVPRKVEAIRAFGAQVEPMSRAMLVLFHEEERWREWP
ncbi:MAG TPA: pyridoxal-phosphate dependent enzyme, partial [Thermoplasmata archaeon]|nr:pyridoxal-phosphate dependent enzyme [Thermoplasmata archaeon]